MSGNFGYELDLTKLTEIEKMQAKSQVAFYKEVRELIQFGDFYRLQSHLAAIHVLGALLLKINLKQL